MIPIMRRRYLISPAGANKVFLSESWNKTKNKENERRMDP